MAFYERPGREDAMQPLLAWHSETLKAVWETPADVKAQYRNASIVANSRVVFNIAGNKYRLVVVVRYRKGIVYIRFVGTHEEYDKIDVTTV